MAAMAEVIADDAAPQLLDMFNDSSMVDAELDDHSDRIMYVISACPLATECSTQSFKRAACWSMVSPEVAKDTHHIFSVYGDKTKTRL